MTSRRKQFSHPLSPEARPPAGLPSFRPAISGSRFRTVSAGNGDFYFVSANGTKHGHERTSPLSRSLNENLMVSALSTSNNITPSYAKPTQSSTAKMTTKSAVSKPSASRQSRSEQRPSTADPGQHIEYDSVFFNSVRSPRRQFFSINPEWMSENMSIKNMSLEERTATFPPRRMRRTRSAPPGPRPKSRNPITWENFSPFADSGYR